MGLKVLGAQETHVIGGGHRQTAAGRELHRGGQVFVFPGPAGASRREIEAIPEGARPVVGQRGRPLQVAAHEGAADVAVGAGQHDEAVRLVQNPLAPHQTGMAVLAPGAGNEFQEAGVAAPCRGQHGAAVNVAFVDAKAQVGAEDGFDAGGVAGVLELDQPEEPRDVRDGHRRHVQRPGALGQFAHLGHAIDDGVLGVNGKMDEGGHASSSCASGRRSGAKLRRWMSHGPCRLRAAKWRRVA